MRLLASVEADVRFALRSFASSPGVMLAAIVAIAVGIDIGINTGLFTVLSGLMLREVRAREAEQLVAINQIFENASQRSVMGSRSMFSFAEYETYRDGARTLSGVLAYTATSSAWCSAWSTTTRVSPAPSTRRSGTTSGAS